MNLDCTYKGIATGDSIKYIDNDGHKVEYGMIYRQDPYPFIEHDGQALIGSVAGTHKNLCYWTDSNNDIRSLSNRGRLWNKDKIISIWNIHNDDESRNQLKLFIPKLNSTYNEKFRTNENLFDWNIAVQSEPDTILITTISDFINNGHDEIQGDEIQKKRLHNDAIEAERRGERSYNNWKVNSPYADPKYKHMMENKIRITEQDIRRMVEESIRIIKRLI